MSAVELGWRRFNFFDKNIVLDPHNNADKFVGLKDVSVLCWCASSDATYLGEQLGGVFRVDSHLQPYFWKAYQTSLGDVRIVDKLLFSIGVDDDSSSSVLKVWETTQLEKTSPLCKKTVRLAPLIAPAHAHATVLAVHSSLHAIAVGLSDGGVLCYIGDVIRDKAVSTRWVRVRDASPLDGECTGVAIAKTEERGVERWVIFVLTERAVHSYVVENKTVVNKVRHDAAGCARDCWWWAETSGQLSVANREMLYIYDVDTLIQAGGMAADDAVRGRCLSLGRGHEKAQLVAAGAHLALITIQPALIPTADASHMSVVSIYDIRGQYIGLSCSLPARCRLFLLDQTVMILAADGSLSALHQKHLNAKLEILYRKNLFDVAISLARRSEEAGDYLPSIHAKYGDYLYGKGDFENAMTHYKETIGVLEPSYVIKRYLDGSKISSLCVYLETLHARKQHNQHHTTILVNCYAKLGARKKIAEFIEKGAGGAGEEGEGVDAEALFQILRSANLPVEASMVAMKHSQHSNVLSVMMDEQGRSATAIKYMQQLPSAEVCVQLGKWGRVLLQRAPEETMRLLQTLMNTAHAQSLDLSELLKVFIGDSGKGSDFITTALDKVSAGQRPQLLNTVLELRLRAFASGQLTESEVSDGLEEIVRVDSERALYLAQLFDCPPAVTLILEKTARFRQLQQYLMKKGRVGEMIDLCAQCNESDMWLDALVHVSKTGQEVEETVVKRLLQGVEESRCVHPLVVIDILSRSNSLKVSAVRDYVINWLHTQQTQMASDEAVIADCERKMADIDKQVEQLNFNVQVVQVQKCCACDTALHIPAVHFLCRHSFHLHCFDSYADQSDACPACTANNTQPLAEKTDLTTRSAYQKFHSELNESLNGMSLISEYVKKGLFDAQNGGGGGGQRKEKSSPSPAQNPFDDELEEGNPFREAGEEVEVSRPSVPAIRRTPASSIRTPSNNPFDEPSNNPFDE